MPPSPWEVVSPPHRAVGLPAPLPRHVPAATDYDLGPALSALTGSDVLVTGTKADGSAFRDRALSNVSLVPRAGTVFVVGMDPVAGGVRQFDLRRLERLGDLGREAVLDALEVAGVPARPAVPPDAHHGSPRSSGGGRR